VVETFAGILAQHLAFEEIKNIPDPAERLAAEEVKRQELGARPGVAYAEYNCVATTQAASAEGAADLPAPASCGDCGRYVVDRAKKIIADRFGDADGKEAFDAALRAARSAGSDDENVAFASEVELDDEANANGGSADEDDGAEGSASDDAEAGGSGSGEAEREAGSGKKAADGDESGTGGKADDEESPSEDTKDELEGEGSADTGPEPVAGKNAAATTSEPHEASDTGSKVMALGAGALLLAAGAYVARRIFWT
jgi:hypothetical protein